MKTNLKGSLILIFCSFIWGMAFSAQSSASGYVGPFTFVFLRATLTCAVLFAVYPLLYKKEARKADPCSKKRYLLLGALLGVILFAACALQQAGIAHTSAAKSGFITALYIVIIPIIGLFVGKRVNGRTWIGVAVALAGMCLLCLKDDLSVNIGDLITLGCALMFSFHIITIDKYAGGMNSVLLSAIQFGVMALVALPAMLLTEEISLPAIASCWVSIAYLGIFSGAMGYTLQIVGQKYCEPTLASLLMCLEAVFAAIGGWILLGEGLSTREFIGCALMLSASVIAQLPDRKASL